MDFFFYLLLITKNINYAFFPDIKISVSNSGEVNLDLFLIFEFNPPPLFFFYITPDITISQTTYNIILTHPRIYPVTLLKKT